MLSKKEISQKSIRFEQAQLQALDVLTAKTSRSMNELVSDSVNRLIGESYFWLSDGYLQVMEPELYDKIVNWASSCVNNTILDKDLFFYPWDNTFHKKNDHGWLPNMEAFAWNPVLIISDGESVSTTGLYMTFGIVKGALWVWYIINMSDSMGRTMQVENNKILLCPNLKFFEVEKETFLNHIFCRYFYHYSYARQNYVSLIWKGLGDK